MTGFLEPSGSEFGVGHVDCFGGFVAGDYGDIKGVFDVILATYHDAFVGAETGTCGNEVTADHVFLHAHEVVDLSLIHI